MNCLVFLVNGKHVQWCILFSYQSQLGHLENRESRIWLDLSVDYYTVKNQANFEVVLVQTTAVDSVIFENIKIFKDLRDLRKENACQAPNSVATINCLNNSRDSLLRVLQQTVQ